MKSKEPVWLEYCPSCKRKHYMTLKPCPSCNGRSGEWIALPKSENVENQCSRSYFSECCGCEAYREHLAIY